MWKWAQCLDEEGVIHLNRIVRRHDMLFAAVGLTARWSAAGEVGLMVLLGLSGRRSAVVRMLVAVGVVYMIAEGFGTLWRRPRPFAQLDTVEGGVYHQPGRSFPSRHVASAFAMAAVAEPERVDMAQALNALAWVLLFARVAAGVHYPSDVAAGALIGRLAGIAVRRRG